jgi:hypothetical protein
MDCASAPHPTHPDPHPPQIKSTTLDKWEQPWVDVMARVGNVRANAVWEATLTDRSRKLRPSSSMDERER